MRFKGLEGTVPHQNVPKVPHPWGGREGNKGLIMRITELRYMYYAPINVMPVGWGGGGGGQGGGILFCVLSRG